jgi:Fe-S-cluster containining protein
MYETIKRMLHLERGSGQASGSAGCACCGRCCEFFGGHLHVTPRDLERWRRQGREDLLSRVNRLGWIWVDPQTKRREDRCPFIERSPDNKGLCRIHDTKPDMCRAYPTIAHGRRCVSGVFLKL